jgi:hypothetical protein
MLFSPFSLEQRQNEVITNAAELCWYRCQKENADMMQVGMVQNLKWTDAYYDLIRLKRVG